MPPHAVYNIFSMANPILRLSDTSMRDIVEKPGKSVGKLYKLKVCGQKINYSIKKEKHENVQGRESLLPSSSLC